jgi:hypothetical protein
MTPLPSCVGAGRTNSVVEMLLLLGGGEAQGRLCKRSKRCKRVEWCKLKRDGLGCTHFGLNWILVAQVITGALSLRSEGQ